MQSEQEFLHLVKAGDADAVASVLRDQPELAQVVGDHDKTPLHWAAELDDVDTARVLLAANADPHALTSWGATALDWAATLGHSDVVDLLLSRGAGELSLVTAAAVGKFAEVKAFVESGIASQRRVSAPSTPNQDWPADSAHVRGDALSDALYAAARNGHTPVAEYLLDRGAAVDATGLFGATAVHWAAINGHAATVEMLVSRGANLTIRDQRFDATPEEWAREGGHDDVAFLLMTRRESP